MRGFSAFTPYYAEDVAFQRHELTAHLEDEKTLFSHKFVPMYPVPVSALFRLPILKSEVGFVNWAEHENAHVVITMLRV